MVKKLPFPVMLTRIRFTSPKGQSNNASASEIILFELN